MTNAHDRFFKFVFSSPDRARELLSLALPPDRLHRLEDLKLEAVKGSFVPSELKESFTDLLFQGNREGEETGTPLLVYVLFEHKSAPDASTVLQLLGYLTRIWEPYRIRRASTLPHILPIIVYHGEAEWSGPKSFGDYFPDSFPLAVADPELRPFLIDVGRLRQDVLPGLSSTTRSALAAMQFAATHALPSLRRALVDEVVAGETPELADYFRGLVSYLLAISTPTQESAILKVVRTPAAREVVMTIAEKLINQGRAEAVLTERRKTLTRQLEKKFGLSEEEGSFIESVDNLDRLADALDEILFAESKQQVLAKLEP